MTVLLQILLALFLVALAIGLTSVYWRKIIRQQKIQGGNPLTQVKTDIEPLLDVEHDQQMKAAHLERMKDRATSEKQVNTLKSKVVFLNDVLSEVQKQHEGFSSQMKLLTSADLQLGKVEWDMMCGQLKERAKFLGEIVNSTLELMKYEEMSDIDRDDTVLVNSFCKDVFDGCQHYLNGDVDLRLETEMEDDESIRTNLKCLQKILTNLIHCSMQFTHEGEIVLEVKHHRQKQQNYVMFTVSDTGLGIPDHAKDIAFERMTDSDISIKIIVVRLRLCYALVKLLGGSIYIDRTRPKGTSIIFTVRGGN